MSKNLMRCVLGAVSGTAASGGSPDLDERTIAYLNAAAQPTSGPFAEAINTYVLALDAAGVWETDDEHYLLTNATANLARVNLMNPNQTMSVHGSPIFTQYTGYAGDGAAAYLTSPTNLNALTNFGDNTGSIGIVIIGASEASTSIELGTNGGECLLGTRQSDADILSWGLNGCNLSVGTLPELDPPIADQGYWVVSLVSRSQILQPYQNGTPFTFNQGATYDPASRPSAPMQLMAISDFSLFSNRTFGLYHIGGIIDGTQAAARYAAWSALQTALGGL